MTKRVTDKQKTVLKLVEDYWQRNGVSPTVTDIANSLGVHRNSVYHHLLALTKKGLLAHKENQARAWVPISMTSEGRQGIPILGQAPAGRPIEAIEDIEGWIDLGGFKRADTIFAVRVKGDSMIGANISDGDLAIIRQQEVAEEGDIVLALVDGQDVTIKRLHLDRDSIELRPANDDYEPIRRKAKDVQIQGKLVTLMRDYE